MYICRNAEAVLLTDNFYYNYLLTSIGQDTCVLRLYWKACRVCPAEPQCAHNAHRSITRETAARLFVQMMRIIINAAVKHKKPFTQTFMHVAH